MSVGAVQTTTTTPGTGANGSATTGARTVDKQEFLQLLVAELRNQDPMKPMEDREFIAQLAQFNSLEQMQQMNRTLTQSSELSVLGQLAGYIGKRVTAIDRAANGTIDGNVTGVSLVDGNPMLTVNGQAVDVRDVFAISQAEAASAAAITSSATPPEPAAGGPLPPTEPAPSAPPPA